ncbi:hypothetical protein CEXT_296341 [Caerostris extrusa]|uniref:Uncharacterized protein n=1 Tax=Caerostris extrusa TaxID=172846 RepID=A0AAV4UB33_CAEEX|nr:hypothetical protein CEXT_296341 [Caerostris extrusa]
MNEKDLEVVFAPRYVAEIFLERNGLEWPLFNLLLPMENRLRRFMSKQDLECLLGSLASLRRQPGCQGFIYKEPITEM